MRTIVHAVLVIAIAVGPALADDARTTLGDIPRTYSHYLNAQEAALCRANAATGGVCSYFLNPAAVADIADMAGQVTMRYNVKSRDYLPEGADALTASDDGFLLTQFVAVKRSGSLLIGIGYSNPSYRNLELQGVHEEELKRYDASFNGALRYFEIIGATTIGDQGQGSIGVTAGIVNLTEDAREAVVGEQLETARLDGLAACYAVGFSFDVTERVAVGLGLRLSSTIGVDGEHYGQSRQGESVTQSTTVGGVRVHATDAITIHASYVQDGWDEAKSSLAAYEDVFTEDAWKPFGASIRTVAVGAEVGLADGRFAVRAGYSKELGADIDTAIVPENSVGLGGSVRFDQYVGELAFVREVFLEGGESGQVTNYGVYVTAGYEF